MGMYDSVIFSCPKCDATIEVQSKAGECNLNDISSQNVPIEIAVDISNEWTYCEGCKTRWRVFAGNVKNTIPVYLVRDNSE